MNLNPWNVSSIDEFSYLNCPECDFHTKEKKNFQDHATRNHPLSAVLFSKEVISFLNEINQLKVLSNDQKNKEKLLKTNLVTVHEEIQPYGCDNCKRYFSKKSDLMNHIESEHVEKESVKEPSECDTELTVSPFNDQIKCLICVESFPSENRLKEHVTSVHVEVKQFPCSKCGKCFSRIELLQDHISIVHEGKNVFQCSLCDYKTKLKGNMTSRAKINLNRHIAAVHELKKPFECNICNKKFARKKK